MNKYLIAASAALLLAAPIAASAQDVPVYAQPAGVQVAQDVPSYAEAPPQDEQVRGRIISFDGAYSLQVKDERGFIDQVQLHQGTIINPTGLTLQPGMTVSILGFNSGSFLAANEIDTPYTFDAGVPYYAGHPWDYYGPTISLGFFFGDLGWWHGDYFHGPFSYVGGARYYTNVNISNIYRSTTVYNTHRYYGTNPPRVGVNPGTGVPGERLPRTGTTTGGSTNPVGTVPGERLPRTGTPGSDIPRSGTPYRSAPVSTGTFRGHQFVAPREGGGYYRSASHSSGSHASASHASSGEHHSH
jgi:hypothetical protein